MLGELRGGHRVHFVLAWALCGIDLLGLAVAFRTPLPIWLWAPLVLATFPVFGWALVRNVRVPLLRRGAGWDLLAYLRLLPRGLLAGYAGAVLLIGLGLTTGGGAQDARSDRDGYYYLQRDTADHPGRTVRVAIDRDRYDRMRGAQQRLFLGASALFCTAGSFLVLTSATATAARENAARAPRRRKR
ncbi:hypothetical protein ACIQBJ_14285 [Kitasatospora sp. NPDC088391]|uniref:hypothetical protein n=1 Tax=Kitasatospora sp. NPDC088391 TaxID=3364074 RepID=UPI0038262094